jgi:hypothetical protein
MTVAPPAPRFDDQRGTAAGRARRVDAPAGPTGPAWRTQPQVSRSTAAFDGALALSATARPPVWSARTAPHQAAADPTPQLTAVADPLRLIDRPRSPRASASSPRVVTRGVSSADVDGPVPRGVSRPLDPPTADHAPVRPAVLRRAEHDHEARYDDDLLTQRSARTAAGTTPVTASERAASSVAISASSTAPVAPPLDTVASRFAERVAAPATSMTSLPQRWQPLAKAIVGDRTVHVRTDPVARRALAEAGKIAATTGNVIHLRREPVSAADAAVLAHELTHVAHPSPAPRFFDDHRPSVEERRAEQIADIIRRSPVLPRPSSASEAPRAPRRTPAPARLMRHAETGAPTSSSPSPSSSSSPSSTTVSAADLAARIMGNAPPAVRRATAGGASARVTTSGVDATATSLAGSGSDVVRRAETEGSPSDAGAAEHSDRPWRVLAETTDSSGVHDFLEWIVERIEERISNDMARRGGRFRGEF